MIFNAEATAIDLSDNVVTATDQYPYIVGQVFTPLNRQGTNYNGIDASKQMNTYRISPTTGNLERTGDWSISRNQREKLEATGIVSIEALNQNNKIDCIGFYDKCTNDWITACK